MISLRKIFKLNGQIHSYVLLSRHFTDYRCIRALIIVTFILKGGSFGANDDLFYSLLMNLSIEQLFHYLDIWQALHKCHYFAPPPMCRASPWATGASVGLDAGLPHDDWSTLERLNPFESDCEAHAADGALPSFRLTQFFKVQ